METVSQPPVTTEEGQFCRTEIQFENEEQFNAAWNAALTVGAYGALYANNATRMKLMYPKSQQESIMKAIRGAINPTPLSGS